MSSWWPGNDIGRDETLVTATVNSGQNVVNITTDPAANPLWLILANGRIVYQGTGPRVVEQLHDIVQHIGNLPC